MQQRLLQLRVQPLLLQQRLYGLLPKGVLRDRGGAAAAQM
jgi:hypothetical protein